MAEIDRRQFLALAASFGASLAVCGPTAARSRVTWRERRDLYPQGVASGDPDAGSVIVWTRRPFEKGERQILTVEVAEGSHTVEIRKAGFRTYVTQVDVRRGQTTPLNVRLRGEP